MLIKRTITTELIKHLDKKEMTFIVGPRQSGKTTAMNFLTEHLTRESKKSIYLSLDNESDKPFFTSQRALVQLLNLRLGLQKGFVFIDEIQRKEDAGIFLKGIYDMNLPYKFIVSGSGSVELKEKIKESLAGRKLMFELLPVSFEEFVHYKTNYEYEKNLTSYFSIQKAPSEIFLKEYLEFGGYPRVITSASLEEKIRMMDELFQSFLERDVTAVLKVRNLERFSSLVKLLSGEAGMLVNYSKIASVLGFSAITLKEYVWYLEKMFIISKVTPFFRNVRKEISSSPVFYFIDTGFRNFARNIFGHLNFSDNETGFLFQNFIYRIIKDRTLHTGISLHYWRTTDGAEVDFVLDAGKKILPIEVKMNLKKIEITRSLRSFIDKYAPPKAFVVSTDFTGSYTIEKTIVCFVPFYKLFEMDLLG